MSPVENHQHKTIGIIGFGAFGQLIALYLNPYFRLYAYDPAVGLDNVAGAVCVTLTSMEDAALCDIIILAAPVSNLEPVIKAIAPHLKPGALIMDVGSVKVGPSNIMRKCLPEHVDIVATHPLFGPQSARNGIAGLKIALCPVRGREAYRIGAFLRKYLGLDVIMTTPEDHDREAAMVQGLTHLIAKVLVQMEPLPTRMTTKSFDLIMQAVGMVRHDAPEVFHAIESANEFAPQVRRQFFELAAGLDQKLSAAEI